MRIFLDAAAPAFFQNTDNSQCLFQFQHVDTGLELVASTYSFNIVIELLDAATL